MNSEAVPAEPCSEETVAKPLSKEGSDSQQSDGLSSDGFMPLEAFPSLGDEGLIDVESVVQRFGDNTCNRFKRDSGTRDKYCQHFRSFAKFVGLEQYTPKQLTAKDREGPMWQTVGGRLLLRYMNEGLPDAKQPSTRMVILASLKTVWECGLGLPWPINTRRDFGRTLRGTKARETPKDEDVLPFYKAMEAETDPYLKSLFAVDLSCGLRSANHLARLTWRAIRYENGKPIAIVAPGAEYNFKTDALLAAYLPPLAAEALAMWKAQSENTADGTPIWPMRSLNGRIKDYAKLHTCETLGNLYQRWKSRHGIKSPLTLMHFRHWAKRKAEQAGLDPSTADYLQGHTPATDGGLQYGKVRDWETVIDEQRSRWPDGPLGFAFGPKIVVLDEDAPYLRLIADFKSGRLSELELAMGIAKAKASNQPRILGP